MKPAAVLWLIAIAFLLAAEFVLLWLGQPLLSHAVWEFLDEQEVAARFLTFGTGVLWSHFFWSRTK